MKSKENGQKIKDDNFRIAYNNIQGKGNTSWSEISDLVKQNQWDIILLTETHFKEGAKPTKIKGYDLAMKNRNIHGKKGGGIATLTKKNLYVESKNNEDSNQINDFKTEYLWTEIDTKNIKIALATVYLSVSDIKQNKTIIEQLIKDTTNYRKVGWEVLVIGDFNAHLIDEFGCEYSDKNLDANARLLQSFIASTDLSIGNTHPKCKGIWTWMRSQQKSIIDYVTLSPGLYQSINHIKIDDTNKRWTIASDHNWIEIDININNTMEMSVNETYTRLPQDVNWEIYKEKLEYKLIKWNSDFEEDIDDETKADLAYDELISIIYKSAQETVLTNTPNKNFTSSKLKKKIKTRNQQMRKWKKLLKAGVESKLQWGKVCKAINNVKREKIKVKLDAISKNISNTRLQQLKNKQKWKALKTRQNSSIKN